MRGRETEAYYDSARTIYYAALVECLGLRVTCQLWWLGLDCWDRDDALSTKARTAEEIR